MPFTKYGVANLAQGQLLAGIGASSPSLILKTGQGGLFPPSLECPFFIKVEKYDTALNNYRVLKREIMICTNRSGDTLTITRSAGYCPVDYAAVTQTNTALSFDADDTVSQIIVGEQIEEIQAAVEGKVDIVAGLRTGFGTNKHLAVNRTTGAEESKTVADAASFATDDVVRVKKNDGTYKDVPYSALFADIGAQSGNQVTTTPYEASIAVGDTVGLLPDGLYKIGTEVNTSTAVGGTATILGQAKIDSSKTLLLYNTSGNVVTAVVMTITNDVATYGTPQTIGSVSASGAYGGCTLLDTNKVVISWIDAAATTSRNLSSVVATISGTSISLGSVHTLTIGTGGTGVVTFYSICAVRTTAFAYTYSSAWGSFLYVHTVSGTTITTGTNIYSNGSFSSAPMVVQLDTNRIAFNCSDSTNANTMIGRIFEINSGGSTVTNTYTTSGNGAIGYIAKFSTTEFIYTCDANTSLTIYSKPGAGTVLTSRSLTALAAVSYVPFYISDYIFGIWTGANAIIYQDDGVKRTITGLSFATHYLGARGAVYWFLQGWRLIYASGATQIPQIIKLARTFYMGICTAAGVFGRFWKVVKTGVTKGLDYYLKSDGTITTTSTSNLLIGTGVDTDVLYLK